MYCGARTRSRNRLDSDWNAWIFMKYITLHSNICVSSPGWHSKTNNWLLRISFWFILKMNGQSGVCWCWDLLSQLSCRCLTLTLSTLYGYKKTWNVRCDRYSLFSNILSHFDFEQHHTIPFIKKRERNLRPEYGGWWLCGYFCENFTQFLSSGWADWYWFKSCHSCWLIPA